MSNKVKDISINTVDDTINIKNLDPNNIKIDEKSQKNSSFYYTGYVTIKDLKY